MSQAPVMPLFTDALIGDTTHLSAEEFGAYMLILCATWRNNGKALADNDKTLARVCRVPILRWQKKLRPALIGFFTNGDGCLHQKRLEKEWNYSQVFRERQKRAGKANALKRWQSDIADPSFRLQPNGNPLNLSNFSLPLNRVEREITAPSVPHPQAREASPPLPPRGAGDATPREAEQTVPTVFDDPALKAEAVAALDQCLDAIRGKAGTLAANATGQPPEPRVVQFRERLSRLNTLASQCLTGNTRIKAWDAIAQADTIGDPMTLPVALAADLDAIETLEACTQAAE